MNSKSLILLRGLPGAGKSTLAKVLAGDEWPVYSVDDFFTDTATGTYAFRYQDNHLAYAACIENAGKAMKSAMAKIFIDNTFTLEWEMEPYFALAFEHGYQVHVVTVENRHGNGNIHNISREQLEKMAAKYRVALF